MKPNQPSQLVSYRCHTWICGSPWFHDQPLFSSIQSGSHRSNLILIVFTLKGVGAWGIRRGGYAPCAFNSYLAAWYCSLQQVSFSCWCSCICRSLFCGSKIKCCNQCLSWLWKEKIFLDLLWWSILHKWWWLARLKTKGTKSLLLQWTLANIQRRAETKNLTRNLFKTFP